MLLALFALLAIIIVMAVVFCLHHRMMDKRVRYWAGIAAGLQVDLRVSENSYTALDQGLTEITDAYETDSLQYESTIERLNEEKTIVSQLANDQNRDLRDLREKLERRNETIQWQSEALAGVKRQLDIAQVIISEHDANCLPHIVLTSMEHHKDVALPGI